jgi:hypothetical protein
VSASSIFGEFIACTSIKSWIVCADKKEKNTRSSSTFLWRIIKNLMGFFLVDAVQKAIEVQTTCFSLILTKDAIACKCFDQEA